MRATLAVTTWMVSLVSCYSYTSYTLPDIGNENFIKDCVGIHNRFRSQVYPTASNMLYMTWDPALAQIAKKWASTCQFKHNTQLASYNRLHPNFTSLGENIWSGSVSIFSVPLAITRWYNESKYYDFETRTCKKACGHYTQVVWAHSYKVGCAVQFCGTVSGLTFPNVAHFICNYGPAGNYPTWPYKTGETCSACDKNDMCLDKLCASQQRDATRYNFFPNPSQIQHPSWKIYFRNRFTSARIITYSASVIIIVAIAFVIKHRYPNFRISFFFCFPLPFF